MKDSFNMIKCMARELLHIQMEMFMKENGLMIWLMDLGFSNNTIIVFTLDSGKMTYKMVKEWKSGHNKFDMRFLSQFILDL
jgi:hypothetical protein